MGMDERQEALVAGSRNREREVTMTTAIIGVGNIGGRLADVIEIVLTERLLKI